MTMIANSQNSKKIGLSVILPARNEALNLRKVVEVLAATHEINEVIICEGNSTDNTWEIAQRLGFEYSPKVSSIKQDGKGKFNAVLCAWEQTMFDQIMIWDADATVCTDDQMQLISRAKSDPLKLWTGDRLRGKRENGSMRIFNLIGNHAFAIVWSPFFRKKFDTLCGTKIFPYNILDFCPASISKKDPFGDFSLISGAFFGGFPIESTPVHYLARSYGKTNIRRWSSGVLLLRIYASFCVSVFRKRR
jgi:glycosyltransferase involved in cell wall biosynthesis